MNNNQPQLTQSLIQAQRPPTSPSAKQRRHNRRTALRLSPLAWLKLRLFLHAGDTEVGFFGISHPEDLLYIQDLAVPKQSTTCVSVSFDDVSVADYFDDCTDAGIMPARCGRIWIHTHPGVSPEPSSVDEETFARVFGKCDWAVMAIVAREGATYARLSFSAGPGGNVPIPIEVDWERLPQEILNHEGALDDLFGGWLDEYGSRIFPEDWPVGKSQPPQPVQSQQAYLDPGDPLDDLYDLTVLDQQFEDIYFDSVLEGVLP